MPQSQGWPASMLALGVMTAVAGMLMVLPTLSAHAASSPDDVRVLEERPATGNDVRPPRAHNSPEVAVDPTDDEFLALANRLDNPDFSCALQLSADGGRGWVPADPVPQLPEEAEKCYAPQVAFDAEGTLYYLFVGLAGRGNQPVGVYLTTSDDGGHSFSAPRKVLGERNYQVRMTIDRSVGEQGRIHLVWLKVTAEPSLGGLPQPPNPIVAAHSDDGGTTFSEPVEVSDPQAQRRAVAPAVATGEKGTLHVAYYDLQDDVRDYQGLKGPAWDGNWSVMTATSQDAGETFNEPVVVDDGLVPPERVMLIFTMPPPTVAADDAGNVYTGWHDARNGDWDAFAARSPDGAKSWQAPVRLNDDPRGNGAHQLLPQLAVAPNGRVEAVFFDRRDDPENVAQHVYYAASTDHGATFGSNVQVTRFPSRSGIGARYAVPSARGKVELGLGLALRAQETAALAAWPDMRHALASTAQQDVFATQVAREAGDDSFGAGWWWPAIAGGGLVGLGAAAWAVRRVRGLARAPATRQTASAGE
jgi:hypothetical protein